MTQLLHSRKASACQALRLMHQINGIIPRGQAGDSAVHALSPLAYRLYAAVSSVPERLMLVDLECIDSISDAAYVPIEGSSHNSDGNKGKSTRTLCSHEFTSDGANLGLCRFSKIWKAEWKLQESKLLWRKGLDNVALRTLDNSVIQALRAVLNSWPPSCLSDSEDKASRTNHYDFAYVSNILSEALRLGGEWISERRAASGSDILKEYLSAASEHAHGKDKRPRQHTATGHPGNTGAQSTGLYRGSHGHSTDRQMGKPNRRRPSTGTTSS